MSIWKLSVNKKLIYKFIKFNLWKVKKVIIEMKYEEKTRINEKKKEKIRKARKIKGKIFKKLTNYD